MSQRKTPTTYAWDTDVFIAWLRDEDDKDQAAIAAVLQEAVEGRAVLLVSRMAFVEVLELAPGDAARRSFERFMDRPTVAVVEISKKVADKAFAVRSSIVQQRSSNMSVPKLDAADSIHLAAAMLHGADALHSHDMSKLNGNPALEGLKVCKPLPLSGQPLLLPPGADAPFSLHGTDPDDALRRALTTALPDDVKRAERDAGEAPGEPAGGQPEN